MNLPPLDQDWEEILTGVMVHRTSPRREELRRVMERIREEGRQALLARAADALARAADAHQEDESHA